MRKSLSASIIKKINVYLFFIRFYYKSAQKKTNNKFNAKNIIKGFEVTGIHPFNTNIFGEEEFLFSYVTVLEPLPSTSGLKKSRERSRPTKSYFSGWRASTNNFSSHDTAIS